MNDTGSDRLINDDEIERLRAIFDKDRRIETDEDLLELAKLTEDESFYDEFCSQCYGADDLGTCDLGTECRSEQ